MSSKRYTSLRNSKNINGLYRARVENNIDPLGIGRVQVRVPIIHGIVSQGGISSANLPWATMCSLSAGYNYGTYIVPEIGEYVFVMFEDGDTNKPVYLGSIYGTNSTINKEYGSDNTGGIWYGVIGENEVPKEAQRVDYPSLKMIYKSKNGTRIYLNDDENNEYLRIADTTGKKFEIDSTNDSISMSDMDIEIKIENDIIYLGNSTRHLTIDVNSSINIYDGNGNTSITIDDSGVTKVNSDKVAINTDSVGISYNNLNLIESDYGKEDTNG